jgi:lactobin A/cerein 7B family class IIb bacteriocin
MNLENLNLVELNAQEVQEVEGGIFPLLLVLCVDAFMLSTMASYAYHSR